jgi:hypothetical protein
MTYRGTIRNGVVVFQGKRRPSDGTPVEVRPLNKRTTAAGSPGSPRRRPVAPRKGSGRGRGRSLDDIARANRASPGSCRLTNSSAAGRRGRSRTGLNGR